MSETEAEERKPEQSRWRWAAWGLAGLLLLVGAVGGTLIAVGGIGSQAADAATVWAGKREAIYVSVAPEFTVNFQADGSIRFLQVGVDVMTRDIDVSENVKRHLPAIRNDLLLLFSAKTALELMSPEGKAVLQREVLAKVQDTLLNETGEQGVEAVYFTSFVMQ